MNCGMRFDELMKMKMDTIKRTKYGISFSIEERTKTEFQGCRYVLRAWPGEILCSCILMDPQISLCNWVLYRGDTAVFLFCSVVVTERNLGKRLMHWLHAVPTGFNRYTGSTRQKITWHSARRGSIQILGYLGAKDSCMMHCFGIKGDQAYLQYTELCDKG